MHKDNWENKQILIKQQETKHTVSESIVELKSSPWTKMFQTDKIKISSI